MEKAELLKQIGFSDQLIEVLIQHDSDIEQLELGPIIESELPFTTLDINELVLRQQGSLVSTDYELRY